MVQINMSEAEYDAMRKAGKKFDEMSALDVAIVGTAAKHLVIPICDVYNLRRIAGVLHGLAADLDGFSRRGDLSARTITLCVQDAVSQANDSIRRMAGKNKRKRSFGGEHPRTEGDPPPPRTYGPLR